ncbi:MAG: ATP-binding protein [Defluviitaleaceae bacterium]|nr:ATP-binding protein [Defluviitaleaceae bacterium]
MQKIIINKLGPIDHAELECTKWIVFIGAQSTGKSTVAKAIFFFRKVGESIFERLAKKMHFPDDSDTENFTHAITRILQERFLDIFGSYVAMSKDIFVQFYYANETHIKISLSAENTINIEFSENILQYLSKFDAGVPNGKMPSYLFETEFETDNLEDFRKPLQYERLELQKLFENKYADVYIPAGRSMVTLLTEQLDYMAFTMDDAQRNRIDFCTKRYLSNVLALRPIFNKCIDHSNLLGKIKGSQALSAAEKFIKEILKARYVYSNGVDYLELPNGHLIRINLASSGQQESVWITNLIFYHLLQSQKSAFIIEEPESNLYPETQKQLIDLIALTANQGNNIIITTHSPYILGSINNLLYAGQFAKQNAKIANKASKIIDKDFWIDRADLSAWHVKDGTVTNCIDDEIGQIENELIDKISRVMNRQYDDLLDLEVGAE